jgi:Tfp pilus assembly protein PilF
VALAPKSEPARRARAVLLADRDPAKAKQDVDALLRINPHHPIANTIDAAFKARRGEWRAAELAIENIGNADAFPPALYLLAVVEMGAGHRAQAEDSLTRYLGKYPRDPKALDLKAKLLLERGNTADAVSVLKTALLDAPDDRALTATLADA